MNKSLAYILLILIPIFNFSINLDSIYTKINGFKNEKEHINLLYKYSLNKKIPNVITDSLRSVLENYKYHKDSELRGYAYIADGKYYIEKGQPNKAIELLIRALKIGDSCKNNSVIMIARNKLAYINKVNDNFKVAINHAHESLRFARILKDTFILTSNYTLLGNIYKTQMLLDSSLHYHKLALKLREVANNPYEMALTYNNLGLAYKNLKEYQTALVYLRKSLNIKLKINDNSIYSAYNNISIVFNRMHKYDSAIYYGHLVLAESFVKKTLSAPLIEGLAALAEAYNASENYRMSSHYFSRLRSAEDSINRVNIDSKLVEIQSKYESDKKDAELLIQSESLKTAEALNSRKNILISLSFLALMLALMASVLIYRGYQQSKRNAFEQLEKNKIIEEKNKEITDSINYAKSIQQSLITSDSVFNENLRDYFILYQPKDIVSGDFYWAQKVRDGFLIMCSDCTGHGVPGAFMSLLGVGYLKEIVNQQKIIQPNKVLDELRLRIIESFGTNSNKDGMDASLVKLSGLELEIAAANNSVWIVRDGKNIVIKPDKYPIGKYHGELTPFTLKTVSLQKDDLVFLYTDGYADQFGGPNNKKHKYAELEKLIIKNQQLSMSDLKQMLLNNLISWKGKNEQVDDVLVIGFKI